MALDFVKPDVTRYLLGRRFEGVGAPGEAHVIFPYPGQQPLPFAPEEDSSETSSSAFRYPDEKRWWIWPLRYVDEIPLPEEMMQVIRANVFLINSLSGGRHNTLAHLVPLTAMAKLGYPASSVGDAAELEFISLRARLVTIVLTYKTSRPDLFGETFSASTEEAPEPEPKLGRIARGIQRISPTLARKMSSRNLRP